MQVKWLFATAICILTSTFLGAFNAFLLINRKGNITWSLFLPIYWLAWAFSLVTPGQIGDVATISSLLKKHKIDWHLSLGRSLIDKLLSFVVMLTLATTGLYLISTRNINHEKVKFIFLWLTPLLILLLYFFQTKISLFFSPSHSGVRGLIGRTLLEAKTTAQQHPYRIFLNILLSCVKIMLIGTSYWCVFKAMGTENIDMFNTIALSAVSSLIAYIPISFNGIGTAEASGLVLFSQLGITAGTILTGYLTLRILGIMLAWIPSASILLFWRKL